MKTSVKRRRFSSFVVVLLVCLMTVTSASYGFTKIPGGRVGGSAQNESYITSHSTNTTDVTSLIDGENTSDIKALSNDDQISLMIKIDETSLFDLYARSGTGMSYSDYALTRNASVEAQKMVAKQMKLFAAIAREVNAELQYSYTGVMNGIAIGIKLGDRERVEEIASKTGYYVTSAMSDVYEAPQAVEAVTNDVAVEDTGIFKTDGIDETLQGEGMLVAVIDSGLDYEHPVFADYNLPLTASGQKKVEDSKAPDKSDIVLDENDIDQSTLKLPYSKLVEIMNQQRSIFENAVIYDKEIGSTGSLGAQAFSRLLTPNQVWKSYKVPYGYDYSDKDPETNVSEDNSHGTHVSGIITGYYDGPVEYGPNDPKLQKDGTPMHGIKGVATKAQVMSMKVFGDFDNGATTAAMVGALEDSATLGADVINMSLGFGSGFTDSKDEMLLEETYKNMLTTGISIVVAAGNGSSAGKGGHWGSNLTSNPDSGVVGSPSTMYGVISVASIDGVKAKYILAQDNSGNDLGVAYFSEAGKVNGDKFDFISALKENIKANKYDSYITTVGNVETIRVPYTVIPGLGYSSDYTESMVGRIAIVSRGVTTFAEKMSNARASGALGAVIYNNVGGLITMSIEGELEKLNYPACSITMDAASNFKNIKEGVLVISTEQKAGPFMSEFSSWGPTPSLELKPEITGHGGEIYSSYPDNSYDRISGTSMATPNIAGLTLLMRQHLSKPEIAKKYGIYNEEAKAVDPLLLEQRVYQIMMSTATIPYNEEGNPYSPRKAGAGVANIYAMVESAAYAFVKEFDEKDPNKYHMKSRTKIELYDDPDRTGEYTLEFTVRNTESTALTYMASASVFTETVASDKKTVAEKATMFTGPKAKYTSTQTVYVNGVESTSGKVEVAGNSDVDVRIEIKLGEDAKNYIKANFANGMFVEGYASLVAVNPENTSQELFKLPSTNPEKTAEGYRQGYNITVPYLAFFGDWLDAPIFDYSIYEVEADDKDDSIKDADKRYAQSNALQPLGKMTQNGNDSLIPMGRFIFYTPDEYEDNVPAAKESFTTLSFNTGAVYELYYVSGFLRPCKTVNYTITDKVTGEVLDSGTRFNNRKDALYSNLGGTKLEIDPKAIGCKNGGTYVYTMSGVLDYERNGGQTNNEKEDGTPNDSWSFEFTMDTDAPVITDTKLRVERTDNYQFNKFLDFYVTDETHAAAMSFNLWKYDIELPYGATRNKESQMGGKYISIWDQGVRPLDLQRNSTSRVTFSLNSYWEHLRKNDFRIAVDIFDYAFNSSFYEIDLTKLYKGADEIDLIDKGAWSEFTNPDDPLDKIRVLDDFQIRGAGTLESLSSTDAINIKLNQSVNLKYALQLPANVWQEDVVWTSTTTEKGSTASKVVVIDSETGEIFAKAEGTAYVTVRSKTNKDVYKTLKVHVLTPGEMTKYNISEQSTNDIKLKGAEFTEDIWYIELNAGETRDLSIRPTSWFYSEAAANQEQLKELSVVWTSSHPDALSVSQWNNDMYSATITGALSGYRQTYDSWGRPIYEKDDKGENILDDDGNPIPVMEFAINQTPSIIELTAVIKIPGDKANYTARLYVYVKPEYVVSAGTLTEYNGTGYNKIGEKGKKILDIPWELEVKTIGERVFLENNDIEHVVVPTGVTKIDYAAFAYCHNLKSVELPDTIKTISEWAFAADSHPLYGYETKLQRVKAEFKDAAYIGRSAFVNQVVLGSNQTIKGDFVPKNLKIDEISSGYTTQNYDYAKELDLSNVRVIGTAAFFYNAFLSEVDISGVRSMGELAFAFVGFGLYGFTEDATLPKNMSPQLTTSEKTRISSQAFVYCAFAELDLKMDYIPYQAFAFSYVLKTLKFSNDNLIIDSEAFLGCEKLESITFKENGTVHYIGSGAFAGFDTTDRFGDPDLIASTKVKSISWNNATVKVIEDGAFYKLTGLTTLELPKGLTYLGSSAFEGCTKITKLVLPSDFGNTLDNAYVTLNDAFVGCTGLATVEFKDGINKSTKYSIANNTLIVAKTGGVKEIAFIPTAMSLSDYKVPEEVTRIGAYAFANSSTLGSIDLSDSDVTEIGVGAFMNCTQLDSVTLNNSITSIPAYAFYGCSNLTTVTGADKVTEVGNYSFFKTGLDSLGIDVGSLVLPALESMGIYAFASSKMISLTLPNTVTTISRGAFENTLLKGNESGRQELAQVETIGERAFANTFIASISSTNVKTVGKEAFIGCSKLITVQLQNCTSIGDRAFYGQKTDADNKVTVARGKIANLNIQSVVSIGDEAFRYQDTLSISPTTNALVSIGDYAFANSSLSSFTFGTSLQTIGNGAFESTLLGSSASSSGLVTISANVNKIGEGAFAYTSIKNFAVNSANTTFEAIDGVLFRNVSTGKELVQYPVNNSSRREYIVPEGTVKVAAKSFYSASFLHSVTLPASLKTVGDKAFFETSELYSYRFLSLTAPVLETWFNFHVYEGDRSNDVYDYYWPVYANFYNYYSISDLAFDAEGNMYIVGDYIFNSITGKYTTDQFPFLNNDVTVGGINTSVNYGLIMSRPSNGIGYDTFVYSNYFAIKYLDSEAIEERTQTVINSIAALPAANALTLSGTTAVLAARSAYNALKPSQQALVNTNKLTELENAIFINGYSVDVTFMTLTGSTKQTIVKNGKATNPGDPFLAGYTFDGWYQGSTKFLFDEEGVSVNPVSSSIILEARWFNYSPYWNVTLVINGQSSRTIQVAHNGYITIPESTEGFDTTFVSGWLLNGESFNIATTKVTKALTLNADLQKYTVTFAESDFEDIQVDAGVAMQNPGTPSKSGYKFIGWYLNGEEFDFENTQINGNITLTAQWEKDGCGCGTIALNGFNSTTITILLVLAGVLVAASFIVLKRRKTVA